MAQLEPTYLTSIGVPIGAPLVQDVVRDGSFLAVLWVRPREEPSGTYFTPGFAYSRDDGETWTSFEHARLPPPAHVQGFAPTGLLVAGGELYVLVPGVMGDLMLHNLVVSRMDLETGEATFVGTLPTGGLVNDLGGAQILLYDPGTTVFWHRYDLATVSEIDRIEVPPIDGRCTESFWGVRGSGVTQLFVDAGQCGGVGPLDPAQYCIGGGPLEATFSPTFSCVPLTSWPGAADYAAGRFFSNVTWGVLDVAAGSDATRLLSIDGTPAVVELEVGPGRPYMPDLPRRRGTDHRRFHDLVALADGGDVTLYRASRGPRFIDSGLPTTACAPGVTCGVPVPSFGARSAEDGTMSVEWALPLGGSEYLLFYVVDMAPADEPARYALYAARERFATGPAQRGGEIERACARASACQPEGAGFDVPACASTWMAATADRDAFLAARTCDELAQLQAGLVVPCAASGWTCIGDSLVSCGGGTGGVMTPCRALGGSCDATSGEPRCVFPGIDCTGASTASCDASGRFVSCDGIVDCAAHGLECDPTRRCVGHDPACAGGSTNVCAGEVATSCAGGTSQPGIDCSLAPGLACDATTGGCRGDDDCIDSPSCDGTRLRYCLFGSSREVDCADFGAGCDSSSGAARCGGRAALPADAGVPEDAGPGACAPSPAGGAVGETAIADYPTPVGGPIADGTYVLTRYDVWSAATQPYTHTETLVIAGASYTWSISHSALGVSSTSGTQSVGGSTLGLAQTCPASEMRAYPYTASGSTLVIFDSAFVRTFTRM